MLMKIKNFIFSILYVLVIIYLLIFVPSIFGFKPLVVISGSMHPTLKVGGLLYYHEEDLENFKKDDILVYSSRNHIVSHRIVEIHDNGFITKGDANKNIDIDMINNNRVLGKGTNWSIPYLGLYADFIYTHKYLLVLCIIFLIMDSGISYYKNNKRKVGIKNE